MFPCFYYSKNIWSYQAPGICYGPPEWFVPLVFVFVLVVVALVFVVFFYALLVSLLKNSSGDDIYIIPGEDGLIRTVYTYKCRVVQYDA